MLVGALRSGAFAKIHEVEARPFSSNSDIRDRQFFRSHNGIHIDASSLSAKVLHDRHHLRNRSWVGVLSSDQRGGFTWDRARQRRHRRRATHASPSVTPSPAECTATARLRHRRRRLVYSEVVPQGS